MLPYFIIVGTQKSGTTALADILGQHPHIHVPRGEANFFDKRFERGLEYYERFLSSGITNAAPTELILGEKTPGYAISPDAPTRMFDTTPGSKLIWIFRDPVKRAYSHYWFSIQNGQDKLSFEDAVALEGERGNRRLSWTYLRRGHYAEQIRRYLEHFPKEQMLFLLFEQFKSNPEAVLEACTEFLGLGGARFEYTMARTNPTRLPWSVHFQWFAHERRAKYPFLYRVARALNLRRRTTGYPPIDEAMARRLYDHYAPHNEALADLTGLDLSSWNKKSS